MKYSPKHQPLINANGKRVRYNLKTYRISASVLGGSVLAQADLMDKPIRGEKTGETINLTTSKKDAVAIRKLIEMNLVS